jgi:KDO2-lipid IV(A) lauroyltransferase
MPCFKALRRGELVAFVAERDVNGTGQMVEFFGKLTSMPRGPAEIAARSNAPIIPAFLIQDDHRDRFKLIWEEPIDLPGSLSIEERTDKIQEQVIDVFQKYISRYPSQWFAFYKVWKQ